MAKRVKEKEPPIFESGQDMSFFYMRKMIKAENKKLEVRQMPKQVQRLKIQQLEVTLLEGERDIDRESVLLACCSISIIVCFTEFTYVNPGTIIC